MVPINCRISSIGIFPMGSSTPLASDACPPRLRASASRSSWTASRFHPWYPRRSWRCPWFPDGPDGMAIFCGGQPWLGELLVNCWLIFWGYRTVLSIIIILYFFNTIIIRFFLLSKPTVTSLAILLLLTSHPFLTERKNGAPCRSRRCDRCDAWGGEKGTCFALSSSLVRRAGCCFRSPWNAVKRRVVNGVTPVVVKLPYVFFLAGKRMMILIWYWAVNLGFLYFFGKSPALRYWWPYDTMASFCASSRCVLIGHW